MSEKPDLSKFCGASAREAEDSDRPGTSRSHHGKPYLSAKEDQLFGQKSSRKRKGDYTAEVGSVVCAVCPKRAYKSCLTCMASYCTDHVKPHHSAPALQRHRLVVPTENLRQRLCQRHDRELELYCQTDKTAICGLCVAKEHKGHAITELLTSNDWKNKKSKMEEETDIPPPECLSVNVQLTSVVVSWRKPTGVCPTSYTLTLISDGSCVKTASTTSPHYRFSELALDKEYCVKVTAVMNRSQSRLISKTFKTGSIPDPENLTVASVTPTSADLSWNLGQGMEQIPHSFLISYHSEGTEPQTISTVSCSTTLTGLQPTTQYTVSVCCELRDGRKSQATSTTIQTGQLPHTHPVRRRQRRNSMVEPPFM